MRKFLASLVLASAAFAVVAEDPKPAAPAKKPDEKKAEAKPAAAKKRAEVTLHVGDPPPALTADQWLQAEVKSFEKGKIYVVEFWATWCGPCIVMMPHMAEMQAEYRDRGVTFIGYTKKDDNNLLEKVEAFVKRRGAKLGYTFCYAEEPDVYEAWMDASGNGGIPCCYVVDRDTKIAYMGHPMYLDFVLPKVVDGTWTPADVKAVDGIEKEVNAVFQALDEKPEVVLKTLADFEKKYPAMVGVPYFIAPRLAAMLKLKKYDDVKILARNLMTKGRKNSDDTLYSTVARSLRGPEGKTQPALMELALKSADEALALLGDDSRAMLNVAQTSYAAGDKARGKTFATKAVAAAELRSKSSTALQAAQSAIEEKDKATGVEFIVTAMKSAKDLNKHYVETMSRFRAPTDAMIQADAAGFFVKAGDKASGAEYAKKAIESAPANGKAGIKVTLARTYLGAGEKKIGDTYAKEALDEAAENAKPLMMYNLAVAYYGIGEKVTAHDYAEKAIEKAPAQLQRQLKPALKKILEDPDGKTTDK